MEKNTINKESTNMGGIVLYLNCQQSSSGWQCTEELFQAWVDYKKVSQCTELVQELTDVIESNDETRINNILKSPYYEGFLERCREEGKDDAWLEQHQAADALTRLKEYRDFAKHSKFVPALVLMCCDFDNNERKQKNCHLNGLVMLDFDHLPVAPDEVWEKVQSSELLDRCLLAHKTISGRGFRLVLKADPTVGNLADNQIAVAQQLGLYEYLDSKCKDASRLSIAPTRANIYHLDPQLFSYYNREFAQQYEPYYRAGHSAPLNHKFYDPKADKADKAAQAETVAAKADTAAPAATESTSDDGYRIGRLSLSEILNERFRTPPEEGFRHDTYLLTAADLYILSDHNTERAKQALSQLKCVQDFLDEHPNESVERFVEDGAKRVDEAEARGERYNLTGEMNDAIRRLCGSSYYELKRAGRSATQQVVASSVGLTNKQLMQKTVVEYAERLGELAETFEDLRMSFGTQKPDKYPALFVAKSVTQATLLTRTHYMMFSPNGAIDTRLNAQGYIIGPSGSGKSSVKKLSDSWALPMIEMSKKAMDAHNSRIESGDEFVAQPTPPNPIMEVKTTQAEFVEQMAENFEMIDGEKVQLHCYTFCEEVNTLNNQYKQGYYDRSDYELHAFDNGIISYVTKAHDQKRYSTPCMWNILVTGTESALNNKFTPNAVENGRANRSIIAPYPADNKMCPFNLTPDEQREQYLTEAARKLYKVKGKLGGEQGFEKLIRKIWEYNNAVHERAQNEPDNVEAQIMPHIMNRGQHYGFSLTAGSIILRHWDQMVEDPNDHLFYVPESFIIDDLDWQLCKWVLDFFLETQWYYFGGKYLKAACDTGSDYYVPLNILPNESAMNFAKLPAEFTPTDVEQCYGVRSDSARKTIQRLIEKGLVEKVSDGRKAGQKTLFRKINPSTIC